MTVRKGELLTRAGVVWYRLIACIVEINLESLNAPRSRKHRPLRFERA